MAAVIYREDKPKEHEHDKDREWRNWKKGETNPNSTEPDYSGKEEKWSLRIDTELCLI